MEQSDYKLKWVDKGGMYTCPKCSSHQTITTAVSSEEPFIKEIWFCTECHLKEERTIRHDQSPWEFEEWKATE